MAGQELLQFERLPQNSRARMTLDLAVRSRHRVNPLLYGKFCEHLGYNIYQGMDAQILYNATFGKIRTDEGFVRGLAQRQGWPEAASVLASYQDGAALGWFRRGEKSEVLLSPDAGPYGNQAQRFETPSASAGSPRGIGIWTYLPLRRVRRYEFHLVARAMRDCRVELQLAPVRVGGIVGQVAARASVDIGSDWGTFSGTLDVPVLPEVDPATPFLFALVTSAPANVVLDRILLYPADHVHHADPDIVRMLKESRLPLLRWPGGNFTSGYHWRDGVGPVDRRPTTLNPVWHGIFEPNLFGTDEFITYCRDVGCEPMICVNAGNGTPQEAAAWVEYCNGSADTPMGALRVANGHRQPYNVRYWEIGNEIFGRHQIGWTTPMGNVDRYLRFAQAMQGADRSVRLLACGGLHLGVDAEWNQRLNDQTGGTAACQTHHILEGGEVDRTVDVTDLYHAFMGYPARVAQDYRLQRQRMLEAGIRQPRLAITELQLFAFVQGQGGDGFPIPPKIPTAATISEALYATLFIHESIRLGDLVEMITHTATVNHGGGLRKAREQVLATPVHYAHTMGADLVDGEPVGIHLACGSFSTRQTFGHLPLVHDAPNLDAMAVLSPDETLLTLMVVHRSAEAGPIDLAIDLGGFPAGPEASVLTLAGDSLADQNTFEEPARIIPQPGSVTVTAGCICLTVPPYSVTRVQIRKGANRQ
jgi:alpha-L-arabinofuranosidase